MWRKRKWIIISVLAAAVILVTGILGVAAYAQTTTPSATSPQNVFAAKVATILGVDQAKVEAAFKQARKEMQTDAQKNRLQNLVKEGKMTQDQADQYLKWLESRPDVPAGTAGPNRMMGPGGGRCFPGFGPGPGGRPAPAPSVSPTPTK
jgi:hypothetical protein